MAGVYSRVGRLLSAPSKGMLDIPGEEKAPGMKPSKLTPRSQAQRDEPGNEVETRGDSVFL